jgi:hypothetical protein
MQFRRLSLEELEELKDDFIRFLAANQVTATDWEQIKTQEPEKAGSLLDLFSDLVFERVLKNLEYLEFKTPYDLKTFHCREDKILMLGLMVDEHAGVDFTREQAAGEMMQSLQASGASLKLYSAEKAYSESREDELFRMMENGCLISKDGALYKLLAELRRHS